MKLKLLIIFSILFILLWSIKCFAGPEIFMMAKPSCGANTITITGQPSPLSLTVGGSDGSIGTATATSGDSPTATSSNTGYMTISGTSTVPVAAGTAYVDWNVPSPTGGYCVPSQVASSAITVSSGGQAFGIVGTASHSNNTWTNINRTGVTAGNGIVLYLTWQSDSGGTPTVTDGNSTDNAAFVAGTQGVQGSHNYGQFFYLTSSAASGSVNYSATLSGASALGMTVWEVTHATAMTLDTQSVNYGNSTGPATSGNISTANAVEIVFGGVVNLSGNGVSSPLINGVAMTATAYDTTWTGAGSGYKIESSTFATAGAQWTLGGSAAWVCNIIAFK